MITRVLAFALSLMLVGCQTSPTSQPGQDKKAGEQKPQAAVKYGRMAHGVIADHYDYDGDGRYEECRRGSIIYIDRNGDGIADLQIEKNPDGIGEIYLWDENFDGVMDWKSVLTFGTVLYVTGPKRVHERAATVFKDDHLLWTKRIPLGKSAYADWEPPVFHPDDS